MNEEVQGIFLKLLGDWKWVHCMWQADGVLEPYKNVSSEMPMPQLLQCR